MDSLLDIVKESGVVAIINDYKNQLEHKDKLTKCLKKIKKRDIEVDNDNEDFSMTIFKGIKEYSIPNKDIDFSFFISYSSADYGEVTIIYYPNGYNITFRRIGFFDDYWITIDKDFKIINTGYEYYYMLEEYCNANKLDYDDFIDNLIINYKDINLAAIDLLKYFVNNNTTSFTKYYFNHHFTDLIVKKFYDDNIQKLKMEDYY